ncbi:hypothetical protein EWH21_02715 [Pseudomonas sp. REST10]|nr:hypothetical protein EWH21_02715 [Pseudomonas sp. REST10]
MNGPKEVASPDATGGNKVDPETDLAPFSASCLNVAEQFKAKYPNITVNILDNQGVMLRPPRKTP